MTALVEAQRIGDGPGLDWQSSRSTERCTKEELASPVSEAAVEAEFSRRVAEAEAGVIGHVRKQKLPQDQFDALVSLTYNAGVHGSRNVYTLVDTGRPAEAAAKIRSMTSTHVNGKKVLARGLVSRRAEESAPFQEAAKAAAVNLVASRN